MFFLVIWCIIIWFFCIESVNYRLIGFFCLFFIGMNYGFKYIFVFFKINIFEISIKKMFIIVLFNILSLLF